MKDFKSPRQCCRQEVNLQLFHFNSSVGSYQGKNFLHDETRLQILLVHCIPTQMMMEAVMVWTARWWLTITTFIPFAP